MRADLYLYRNGIAASRTRAAALIRAGAVRYGGKVLTHPAEELPEEAEGITVSDCMPYVSRGGEKLAGALASFSLEPCGMTAADIGASTGGFTDCLLQHGASRVYALDAGTGQLAQSLRDDPRVICMEKCNARFPLTEAVPEACALAVSDVSFISQTLILPNVPAILKPDGMYLALVKPQFECGPAALHKNGVVKDVKMHRYAIRRVADAAVGQGLSVLGLAPSPIRGGDGNREFWLLFGKCSGACQGLPEERIKEVLAI